jgi:omega-6 fatty acid desaturase (delta-12 desaturase)
MYRSLDYSYLVTLALAIPAAGFMVRIFIVQHDCGHGSFFKLRKVNNIIGSIFGVLTLTPYYYWRKSHAIHHGHAGNLERRGIGDVYTMTVNEYRRESKWGRLKYRLYRNPFLLFTVSPTFLFVVLFRFFHSDFKSGKKERASVHLTNLAILAVVLVLCSTIGWKAFFMIQIPLTILSSTTGAWYFYVQHQFEETYWENEGDWEYSAAALQGSSYYRLPKILQWFSGNIGFHHIHHLSPRIPNYLLEKCHKDNPIFQEVMTLTIWSSIKTSFLGLWDEEQKKLVSFSYLKTLQKSETVSL